MFLMETVCPDTVAKKIIIIFVGNILIIYFYLFERLILTFAQIERLCELLRKRICDFMDAPLMYIWSLDTLQ